MRNSIKFCIRGLIWGKFSFVSYRFNTTDDLCENEIQLIDVHLIKTQHKIQAYIFLKPVNLILSAFKMVNI